MKIKRTSHCGLSFFKFADIICVICMYLGFAQTGFYKVEDLVLGYAQDG